MIKVKIRNESCHDLPAYETLGAAGMDVRSYLGVLNTIQVLAGQRAIIPTGLYFEIPTGYELQVRSRSGLSAKHGMIVLNAPGTIDSDYRGELKIIMLNTSNEVFIMNDGDRIAQIVLKRVEQMQFEEVGVLSDTDRGINGFGSTGLK